MTFKGFAVEYPEYEVITPQTNKSFTLRSLSVQEEEKLKGSLITPAKIAEHLNKCIFTTLVSKPKGIDTLDSSDNIIFCNNFIDNGGHAYDNGVNAWDNGTVGNYWDDYQGVDTDGDGIGDTSYLVPGGDNRDRFPLMKPWG